MAAFAAMTLRDEAHLDCHPGEGRDPGKAQRFIPFSQCVSVNVCQEAGARLSFGNSTNTTVVLWLAVVPYRE
jgi:hypothetical protein